MCGKEETGEKFLAGDVKEFPKIPDRGWTKVIPFYGSFYLAYA